MATLDSSPAVPVIGPGINGTGILIPALQHKFRITFPTFVLHDEQAGDIDMLTQQVINCRFDFLNKTATLDVEMSAMYGALQELVQSLVDNPRQMVVDIMNGADGIHQRMMFELNKCLEHSLVLDYATGDSAKHHLVFEYRTFRTKDRP